MEVVCSHGQTVFHWVSGDRALGTLQLGQPAWIAERTGATVVSDVRSRDIAAGGHGAPLASVIDVLLLAPPPGTVRGALNLGGISNVTVLAEGREPVAFDIGPANALMDASVTWASGGKERFDESGRRARAWPRRRRPPRGASRGALLRPAGAEVDRQGALQSRLPPRGPRCQRARCQRARCQRARSAERSTRTTSWRHLAPSLSRQWRGRSRTSASPRWSRPAVAPATLCSWPACRHACQGSCSAHWRSSEFPRRPRRPWLSPSSAT